VHKVTPGPSDGKNTVILSGLAAGQTVVTDGMDRLSDGAKIKIAAAKPAAAAGAVAPAPAPGAQQRGTKGSRSGAPAPPAS
jgi:membrane fusion protein, multidrug efflux system